MTRLSRRARDELADYYTGRPLAGWRQVARRKLDARQLHGGKPQAWMTTWTVEWVHLGELTLLPSGATATATAQMRSNRGDVNRMDYTFQLVDTAAGWRVSDERSEFVPGYGP